MTNHEQFKYDKPAEFTTTENHDMANIIMQANLGRQNRLF